MFSYRRPDGSEVREYRPPEEVFHADSLASLAGVSVTDLHPPEMVSPANFGKYARGHVGESIRRDADHIAADLFITAADLIAKVDARKAQEVSCGYTCTIDPTPGVSPKGERYDVVQRGIVYNHAALGPDGWGRAGASASLRLDGDSGEPAFRLDAAGHQVPFESTDNGRSAAPQQMRFDSMATVRIDGVDYDPSTTAFSQAFAKHQERADAAVKQAETLTASLNAEKVRADTAEGKVKELETKLADAASPARIDSLVTERVALVTTAQKYLPAETKLDGKSPDEIKRLVVEHNRKALKLDGKDAGYIAAAFDAVVAEAPATDERRDHLSELRSHTAPGVTVPGRRVLRADRLTLSNG